MSGTPKYLDWIYHKKDELKQRYASSMGNVLSGYNGNAGTGASYSGAYAFISLYSAVDYRLPRLVT